MPLIYDELHRRARALMRGERDDHTLQATVLVNEVYLKLIDQKQVPCNSRTHFFRVAARRMRQILVDHARGHRAEKRGGKLIKISLEEAGEVAVGGRPVDLLALDEALEELDRLKPQYREIVELRFFSGLTIEQTAEALGLSTMSVKRQWRFIKAWLQERLRGEDEGDT